MRTHIECRIYRLALGMTGQEMADEMYVTRQAISLFEQKGTQKRSISMAFNHHYDVTIDYLWDQVPEDEKQIRLYLGRLMTRATDQKIEEMRNILNHEEL